MEESLTDPGCGGVVGETDDSSRVFVIGVGGFAVCVGSNRRRLLGTDITGVPGCGAGHK